VLEFAASSSLYDDASIHPARGHPTVGDWSGGDEGALEKLFPLVQPELHRLAHHYMSRERAGHTQQTTAILDEAYLRLVDNTKPIWQGRSHFIAVAAQLMRRIMVDHAREHHSLPILPTGATSRRQIARPRFEARRHPSEVSLSEDQNRYPRLFFDS
jgi:RNA polymerase sigma factor (TIGR02999 family)